MGVGSLSLSDDRWGHERTNFTVSFGLGMIKYDKLIQSVGNSKSPPSFIIFTNEMALLGWTSPILFRSSDGGVVCGWVLGLRTLHDPWLHPLLWSTLYQFLSALSATFGLSPIVETSRWLHPHVHLIHLYIYNIILYYIIFILYYIILYYIILLYIYIYILYHIDYSNIIHYYV